MRGTILILDGVATNRILLKAKLAPGCYDVLQADTCAQAVALAARTRLDVIVISGARQDGKAEETCRSLKAQPDLARVPVIAITASKDPALRRAVLAAGAEDVMAHPVDDLTLLARLRSLIRDRSIAEELRMREGTTRALGFAEPEPAFTQRARIALIAGDAATGMAWCTALRHCVPHEVWQVPRDLALARLSERQAPDVCVLALDPACPAAGLRLLADLRARPALRHAGLIVVVPGDAAALAADALDMGAADVMRDGFEPRELALRLGHQVRAKQTKDRLRATVRSGLAAAIIDPLTGLYNRRYVMPHLARIAAQSAATGRQFTVMMADLDHFKSINDSYGHPVGDAVLCEAARRLSTNLRAVDLVARMGGEEFLIVMPDTDSAAARSAGERLRGLIDDTPFAVPGSAATLHVTVSIGITVSREAGPRADPRTEGPDGPDRMIDLADRALYNAKDSGRNRVRLLAAQA
ncbi:MAG: diguanylate cyclase [Rhodobacteraceae bacterium]|nr:diguanylate cyclase [Paracoccaceae bacterium]